MKRIVIFTDLDGTLLDHATYSFEAALPALRLLEEKGVPLIISSSKTRAEIECYRQRLGNRHPFVAENGGGIFVPVGYFDPYPLPEGSEADVAGEYSVIRLGARYRELRSAVKELRTEGFPISGFADMSVDQVAELTGLTREEADLARQREFDEPFILGGEERMTTGLEDAVRAKGFSLTRGRFFHILGESDKGRAFAILASLYRLKFGDIITVALGDSPNDIPMLERADRPVIVRKPGGGYDPSFHIPKLIRADGIGPVGWNRAVLDILGEMG